MVLDATLPDRIRVAIGFTSAGRKGKAIGECWDTDAARMVISRSSFDRTSRMPPTQ